MAKEMLINVSEGEECRIALMEDGKLEELYMERTSSTSHVGNIYKGRVTNVEPSIQAAFVDFGLGRNGFLHISDLMPHYFGRAGNDVQETVGRKMARRDRPPIQRCLRRGDEIVVQIIKEGIGTKGPTLSSYISIPGRILVMMPGMGKMGVSKKIEDDAERRRLRQILDGLKPPKDVGFIIRTAGIGKSKTEIERDLKYLTRLWEQIEKKRTGTSGPTELYTEGDLVTRTVRDVFSADVDRIVVDSKDVAKRVKDVIKITAPRTKNRVDVYEEPLPLFHKAGIEREIELMYSRHVPLPSGGSLVIDSTEAIVAIDVNSGKFRDHSDAEMTAFKTDMEAADEIARQLKLRDLGGVIICDFIDLRYERHRRELEQRLHDNLKRDRAKTKVLRMSQFGIIEMTRQRMRPSLKRSVYFDCPHCKGAGLVKTPESMSLDVMRKLAIVVNNERVQRVELAISPDVGMYLLNKKRSALAQLEDEARKKIIVRQELGLGLDEIKLELYDSRDGLVILEELGMVYQQPPHVTQLGTRPPGGRGRFDDRRQGQGRGGRGGGQQRGGGGGGGRPQPQREDITEDRFELEDADEAPEQREQRERGVAAAAEMGLAPVVVDREDGRGGGGGPGGNRRDDRGRQPQPPAAADGGADDVDEDEDDEDFEDHDAAVDIDEGPDHTIGERPAGEFDRHGQVGGHDGGGGRRRRRRRGGRRRRRGGGQGQPPEGQGQPQPARAGAAGDHRDTDDMGAAPEAMEDGDDADAVRDAGDDAMTTGDRAMRGGVPADARRGAAPARGRADEAEEGPQPGNEAAPATAGEGQEGGGKRRRRRRRGGRGRRRRGNGNGEGAGTAVGADADQPRAAGEPFDDDAEDADAEVAAIAADEPADDRAVAEAATDAGADDAEEVADEVVETETEVVEAEVVEPEVEEVVAEPEPEPAPAPKRKPRARKSPTPRAKVSRTPPKAKGSATAKGAAGAAKAAAAKPAVVADDAPVVKTGSTDSHQFAADDVAEEAEEPIVPAARPASRPRSYRDLDAIPDDYD
jgi:ribonuclease E